MASGEAVRILSTGYTLQPLTNVCPDCIGIVVGPADLSNQSIVNRLKAAYDAGQPVGLTNATAVSIQRLHDLLAHRGSAEPVPGGATADLVAFRKAFRADGQLHSSSHLLLPRAVTTPSSLLTKRDKNRLKRVSSSLRRKLRRKLARLREQERERQLARADRNDVQALSRIFSATPELPEQPPLGSSPQQNLLELAESYESSGIQSDSYGNQVQLVNSVWAARSFTNSVDLYYFLQEADFHGVANFLVWNTSQQAAPAIGFQPMVIQPSPQTTMEATQDTSSTSFNIGGSAGWNQTEGLNASVSGGLAISNSKTTIIPPINITNDANLQTGQTSWSYKINDLPNKQPETIDLFCQWIWQVPFTQYPAQATNFPFGSEALFLGVFFGSKSPFTTVYLTVNLQSSVPIPFGTTFSLQQPSVTGLNPTSVDQGDTFTINGSGLYPSLVQAVLIGGTALNADNISTVSDTQINVVAPAFNNCAQGCSVVVQTTQGTSNDNVTISILP